MHNFIVKIFTSKTKGQIDQVTRYLIIGLFYFVLFLVSGMGFLLRFNYENHSGKSPITYLGTFGDFFGGVVNPILTFFTVVGLAVTIILQRVSLLSSGVQRFETTFFNMLALHNNIVQQLRFNPSIIPERIGRSRMLMLAGFGQMPPVEDAEGRGVFASVLNSLKNGIDEDHDVVDVYKRDLQDAHNYVLGHYFRNLYQILNIIDRQEGNSLTASQAKEYSSVIRAQLSANELAVLFLNCQPNVVDLGRFAELLKKYKMLEHLPLIYDSEKHELRASNFDVSTGYLENYFSVGYQNVSVIKVRVIRAGAYGDNPSVQRYLGSLLGSRGATH